MDLDMHYYGTYALARAAGLKPDAAQTIATASQFVDDSTHREVGAHPGGAYLRAEATAHHPTDLPANRQRDDQLLVWVPFHFLPGGRGSSLEEKLVCVKDSAIAQKMVSANLERCEEAYAVELMGITAHVYADTFAHFGFSGVGCHLNKVSAGTLKVENQTDAIASYLGPRLTRFFKKYGDYGGLVAGLRDLVSGSAESLSGALGHGAVATYPDEPYLHWSYDYETAAERCRPVHEERHNSQNFLEASEALFEMFRTFARRRPDLRDVNGPVAASDLLRQVSQLLRVEGDVKTRLNAWIESARRDGIFKGAQNLIPTYSPEGWNSQWDVMLNTRPVGKIRKLELYRFYQAAAIHRTFVVRELLPANDIVIV